MTDNRLSLSMAAIKPATQFQIALTPNALGQISSVHGNENCVQTHTKYMHNVFKWMLPLKVK